MAFRKMAGSNNANEITLAGSAYSIRFNCQEGAPLKNNGQEKIDGTIEIAILGFDRFTGSLQIGDKPPGDVYDWVEIFYINALNDDKFPQNLVCSSLMRSESRANFLTRYQENIHKKPENLIWIPKFNKKAGPEVDGKKTVYYTVDWSTRSRTKEEIPQLKLIEEFMAKDIPFISDAPIVKIPDYLEGSVEPKVLPNVEIPKALESVVNI
jgi:hypothetical protein